MALEQLQRQAPLARLPQAIPLPAAAPLGTVRVDADTCTLCLSCVSACPDERAEDNPGSRSCASPSRACLQCGLCARHLPASRRSRSCRACGWPTRARRRQPRVVAEQAPYHCIRCSKPFGTLKAIDDMIGKLGGHPAFQGAGAERLKMCGDCRVIDLHTGPEVRITDL